MAGGRAGLAGERSGLFMEQVRVIREMRNESIRKLQMRGADVDFRYVSPRYMVWENVPGAFSSNKGEDFRAVLEETARIADKDAVIPGPPKGKWTPSGCILGDGWSIAWRVHDAQFWGVPQRRKRISLVADFGGQSAPEILFERKSLQRDTDESKEKGQEIAGAVGTGSDTAISFQERAGCEGGGKGILIQNERTASIRTQCNQYCLGFNRERIGAVTMEDKCPTIQAAAGESGNNQPMVYVPDVAGTLDASYYKGQGERAGVEREVVCIEGNGSRESHKGDGYKESETMYTLNTVEQHAVCVGNGQLAQAKLSDKVGALNCMHDQQAVMTYSTQACGDRDNPSQSFMEETAYTVPANPMSDRGQAVVNILNPNDSQGNKVADANGIYPTLRGCSGAGYQQGYVAAPCIGIDRASFNQGKNAQFDFSVEEELAQTIVAKGPGGGTNETVGPLCARDWKGVGNQYVREGKCIVQHLPGDDTED